MPHVIAWDLETIPDISGFAAANGLSDKTAEEVRAAMGEKFPKHIYHSILCIGALSPTATMTIGSLMPSAYRTSVGGQSVRTRRDDTYIRYTLLA